MRYDHRYMLIILIILLLAACGPEEIPEPPTLIPTTAPTLTPLPSPTDAATSVPSPTVTFAYRPETVATSSDEQVYVRVAHAAPGTPSVDVYIELLAIATNLDFGQGTGQVGIVSGDYNLRVVPGGEGPNAEAILLQPISLAGGKSFILVFTGTPDALTLAMYEESTDPLNGGESRISVIHAVPRGADFVLLENNNEITQPLTFGQQSNSLILSSGSTSLIYQSGQNVLYTQPVDLRERTTYTMVLVGDPNDLSTYSALEFRTSVPGRSSIRVIHAATDSGPIDFYLDNKMVAQNLEYSRASQRESAATRSYTVKAFPAGTDPSSTEPFASAQMNTSPDDIVTLIVVGSQENPRIITYREDHSPTAPDEVRIGFANTLDTIPRVRVETQGGAIPEISDITYGQSTEEITWDAGTVSFYWKSIENGVALGDFVEAAENVELVAGYDYLYLFTGRIDAPPLIFGEVVGIDERLADVGPLEPTATPIIPTNIRFINAIETGLLVEFHLDDSPITDPMALKADSPLSQTTLGDHVATVHEAATGALLGRLDFRIETSGNYSIFAYGNETVTQIDLLLVPDVDLSFDAESPHVRLINLSQDASTTFGLAYSTPLSKPLFQSTTPEPEGETNQTFRRSIQIGINRILSGVKTGEFSAQIRTTPGEQSIMVLDDQETAIAAAVPSIDLENGVHYDVVSFQRIGSQEVTVFMLPYLNE